MARKFKVGDRVIGNGRMSSREMTGMIGTIMNIKDSGNLYGVQFVELIDGHNLSGLLNNKSGWDMEEKYLNHYGLEWDL